MLLFHQYIYQSYVSTRVDSKAISTQSSSLSQPHRITQLFPGLFQTICMSSYSRNNDASVMVKEEEEKELVLLLVVALGSMMVPLRPGDMIYLQ